MTREELESAQKEGTWLVQTTGLATPVLVRASTVDVYRSVDWVLGEFRIATPNDMLKYEQRPPSGDLMFKYNFTTPWDVRTARRVK